MLVEAAQATIDTPVEGRLLQDDIEDLMDEALEGLDDMWDDLDDWSGDVWDDAWDELDEWDLDWDGATTVTAHPPHTPQMSAPAFPPPPGRGFPPPPPGAPAGRGRT